MSDRPDSREEVEHRRKIVGQRFECFSYAAEPYAVAVGYVARQATMAFARMDRLLGLSAADPDVFCALHEAINHAGNLSKLFFPPKRKDQFAQARGAAMREYFHVPQDSPLNDRSLRDTLEHYDERLDEFFLMFEGGVLVPTPTIADLPMVREVAGEIFIVIDPAKKRAAILGRIFEYGPLMKACSDIADNSPHRPY